MNFSDTWRYNIIFDCGSEKKKWFRFFFVDFSLNDQSNFVISSFWRFVDTPFTTKQGVLKNIIAEVVYLVK